MEYGAKEPKWAPFAADNPEPANALPNYGAAVVIGEFNALADNPSYAEASAAGDNDATARYLKRFQRCQIDLTVLDMENEVASAVFGSTLDTTPGQKDLHFNTGDNPPYGGLAFYTENLMRGNLTRYQGVFYPKTKANMQGKSYNTTGESITLQNSTLQLMAMACNNGDWKIVSELFENEAEAAAWRDAKLGIVPPPPSGQQEETT